MQHVFIVGSKSMGAYGGYETFVNKLTEYHQNNENIKYHVACKANGDGSMDESKLEGAVKISDYEFEYHNAHCFKINVPNIGPASAIYYDVAALKYCCKYIKENKIDNPVVYILACRIGPFMAYYKNKIHKLGGKVYLNPDGHEWMREKWSPAVRKYWKLSEKMMVKNSDYIICDSVNIEKYIQSDYAVFEPKTTFVAYGADTTKSTLHSFDEKVVNWYKEKDVTPGEYYLVVGRFVPENNYETMIKEFMASDTDKDFVIITNNNGNPFYEKLRMTTNFESDPRIKFVGTVYDQELLKKIREDAFAYFHGHEVGGTNPSLLEALATTNLNLLLDVGFNREVGEDGALYWSKAEGDLAALINKADKLPQSEIEALAALARKRIADWYSWEYIVAEYEKVFLNY
ncbi:MAG: DUF1972 domain-containing protein [Clostridia bacterium]|nr:DUF1972 domain-containing protein [Clostridia bacterium]